MDPNQPAQPAQPTPSSQPAAPAAQSNGLAIAALVVGIVAFLSGWAAVFGMLVGIVAVILGIIALKKKQHKVMSVIGLVLGAIAIISSLIFTIIGAAILTSPEVNKAVNDAANSSEMNSEGWSAADANAAYEKVTNGMTKAQVEEAVGRAPASCSEVDTEFGVTETCFYGNVITDDVSFSVTYQDGAVTTKSKNS